MRSVRRRPKPLALLLPTMLTSTACSVEVPTDKRRAGLRQDDGAVPTGREIIKERSALPTNRAEYYAFNRTPEAGSSY